MKVNELFDFINKHGGPALHAGLWPIYAWCWEVGNYTYMDDGHVEAACLYAFCLEEDARQIVSLPLHEAKIQFAVILAKRMIRGPVVIPVLICGKIKPGMVNYMIKKWKKWGVRFILYHKYKTQKFYCVSI